MLTTIQDKIAKSKEFPFELHVDLTNHCNKGCFICPSKDRYVDKNLFPNLGYMGIETFKRIIDECAEWHPSGFEINLHKDGEPLMHGNIEAFITYAKKRGAFVHFATNGLLLSKKGRLLIDSGLDLLTISVIDTTAFPQIRKFMRNKKIGQKPIVQLKIFKDVDIDQEYLPEVDRCINGSLHHWSDPIMKRNVPCPKLLYNPAINFDGSVTICCVDYKNQGVIGNINSTPLKELWDSIKGIYDLQKRGVFKEPCLKCNYWEETNG